ncbi:MAG: VWA domain-containing protein [Myxococcota bacterium]
MTRTPLRTHALLVASLLTLTFGAGVAARIGGGATTGGIVTGPVHATPGATRVEGGGVHLAATLDRHSVLRGGDGTVRVELVLGADAASGQDGFAPRVPTDLVVVLDRSGSMQGEPLHFAKAAVRELVSRLGAEDRFGLVTYASGGEVAIGLETPRGDARERWQRTLAGIQANGGTNMSRGLDLAHALVAGTRGDGHSPRIVLISDGHANQGDYGVDALRGRAARAVPGEYALSAVGVGQGFDETVMSAIADAGTGNFYYLPDVRELAGVFAAEFAAARDRVAKALEVHLQPGPGVELRAAAGLPLERAPDGVRFRPGDLFAGQERRVWLTLHAPTDGPGDVALGELALRFTDADGRRRDLRLVGLPKLARVEAEDDYWASFDTDAYKRSQGESLGALKEKVAKLMKDGRRDDAVAEVDGYMDSMQQDQLRALGYAVPEDEAAVVDLRARVAAPSAAKPEEQNRLGKELLEAGRDARRVGSKHE